MTNKVKITKEFGAVMGLASLLDPNFFKELSDFELANPDMLAEDIAVIGLCVYAYNTGYAKALEDNGIKE